MANLLANAPTDSATNPIADDNRGRFHTNGGKESQSTIVDERNNLWQQPQAEGTTADDSNDGEKTTDASTAPPGPYGKNRQNQDDYVDNCAAIHVPLLPRLI